MKKMKKLYDFPDFVLAVKKARKHTEVKEMKEDDFFEWPDYSSQYKLGKVSPRPYLNDMVEITVRRGASNVFL